MCLFGPNWLWDQVEKKLLLTPPNYFFYFIENFMNTYNVFWSNPLPHSLSSNYPSPHNTVDALSPLSVLYVSMHMIIYWSNWLSLHMQPSISCPSLLGFRVACAGLAHIVTAAMSSYVQVRCHIQHIMFHCSYSILLILLAVLLVLLWWLLSFVKTECDRSAPISFSP